MRFLSTSGKQSYSRSAIVTLWYSKVKFKLLPVSMYCFKETITVKAFYRTNNPFSSSLPLEAVYLVLLAAETWHTSTRLVSNSWALGSGPQVQCWLEKTPPNHPIVSYSQPKRNQRLLVSSVRGTVGETLNSEQEHTVPKSPNLRKMLSET
jgi:hypothetical protein